MIHTGPHKDWAWFRHGLQSFFIFEDENKSSTPNPTTMQEQYVFFRHNSILTKVNIDEIVAISVIKNNNLKFLLIEGSYVVRSPLYAALKRLPPKQFIRVHDSHAVSIRFINKIMKTSLLLNGNEIEIAVSKRYYNELKKKVVILDVATEKKKKTDIEEEIPSESE
jgi:DNA-binding LytR/AlgR family response regulator